MENVQKVCKSNFNSPMWNEGPIRKLYIHGLLDTHDVTTKWQSVNVKLKNKKEDFFKR